MLRYEKKIREIIASTLKTNIDIDDYDANSDLRNIGMDSISFVSIVVEIENEFGIEFPNDKLIISESGTIFALNRILERTLSDNAGEIHWAWVDSQFRRSV